MSSLLRKGVPTSISADRPAAMGQQGSDARRASSIIVRRHWQRPKRRPGRTQTRASTVRECYWIPRKYPSGRREGETEPLDNGPTICTGPVGGFARICGLSTAMACSTSCPRNLQAKPRGRNAGMGFARTLEGVRCVPSTKMFGVVLNHCRLACVVRFVITPIVLRLF